MSLWLVALILLFTFVFLAVLHFIGKKRHPLKRAALSMLCGVGALLAVNLTSSFTGVSLPVSLLSILTSAVGGLPGVTLMLGLNLFF